MRPLVTELSTAHSPESLARSLRGERGVMLLRSAGFESPHARHSFVVARPFIRFTAHGSRCEIATADGAHELFGNPWRVLDSLMERCELLDEVDEPNCQAAFDAWSPALHGSDLVAAVKRLGSRIVHTTVADYVRRPRFSYVPNLVNYVSEPDAIRAVPMGEGFIDYRSFFAALRDVGYQGAVAYEMCSPLRGGGSEENLDRYAKQFLEWICTA